MYRWPKAIDSVNQSAERIRSISMGAKRPTIRPWPEAMPPVRRMGVAIRHLALRFAVERCLRRGAKLRVVPAGLWGEGSGGATIGYPPAQWAVIGRWRGVTSCLCMVLYREWKMECRGGTEELLYLEED